MPPTNWLKGVVKSVISGDTVIVMGIPRGGPPPEKQISLASIKAPRLGRRDGSVKDESFAWDSREYLRKKAIGQSCVFRTEYTVEQLNNRDFGTVFIGSENLGLTMVENGWARVNRQGSERSYNFEELEKAEAAAQNQALGLWTLDADIKDASIRSMPQESITSDELFINIGKGGEINGIVEQVLNGSLLRVTLLPEFHNMLIAVAGVQSPSMNKRGPDGTTKPEPYAARAKFFTECAVLNRDVKLKLQGLDDRFQNLFAIVQYHTNEDIEKDLGKDLIISSYARTAEWSLSLMSEGVQELHSLERAAKEAKTGIWTNFVPPVSNQDKLSDRFTGTVVEVSSGDCLMILDDRSSTERRVQLSSIRAPRMGTRERSPEDWAIDAKDFLRRLAIGKKIDVQMEYTRKIPTANDGLVLQFGNITFKTDNKTEEINIAEKVVENGFANVARHRTDDERSQIYDRLMTAEETAKSSKRNIHSGKEAPVYRLNDFTGSNAKKAKERFESLKRAGKMQGVVEAVMSGHRVKILLGKERLLVAFALSGVKSPQRSQPARGGQKEVKGEPFAEEAMQFTRRHILQREVTIQLEACDKMGTFLGTLYLTEPRPVNLGLALLERGLASLHFTFDESRPGGKALVQAEKAAKEKKIGIWENYAPPVQDTEEENGAGPSRRRDAGPIKVAVSHIEDGQCFYIQKVNETKIDSITEQLKAMCPAERPWTGVLPTRGSYCLGQFTQDNEWYRGYVVSVQSKTCEVYFIDYGNSEKLPADRIRSIESELASIPPQAHPCELAYLKVPPYEHEIGYEAARMLDSLVGEGLVCNAIIVGRNSRQPAWGGSGGGGNKDPRSMNPKLSVLLTRVDDPLSVNAQLLEAGFAKLPNLDAIRNKSLMEGVLSLKEHEQVARKLHKGLFIYGDPGDSDEEDLPPR
eukprot:g1993.t1